jgi:hypothetical protein
MRKIPLIRLSISLLPWGLGLLTGPASLKYEQIPTPPPAPRATKTQATRPPSRAHRTPTATARADRTARTTSQTDTPTPTATATPSVTGTLTPTLTSTITPTPVPNLHVVAYLDLNGDHLREAGEGVDDLLLWISAGEWEYQAILQDGELRLALPFGLTPDDDVQVQAPYLHWSALLRGPKAGEILEASLRLDPPHFPVSIP